MKEREPRPSPPLTNHLVSKFYAKTTICIFMAAITRLPFLLSFHRGCKSRSERSRTADPIIGGGNYSDERGRGVTAAAQRRDWRVCSRAQSFLLLDERWQRLRRLATKASTCYLKVSFKLAASMFLEQTELQPGQEQFLNSSTDPGGFDPLSKKLVLSPTNQSKGQPAGGPGH